MGKKQKSSGKLQLKKLFDYKTGTLAPTVLAIFYLVFPWFNTGVLDQTTAIFGIMFLTIAVMRARTSNYVLSGFFQALIGICYLFAITGLLDATFLWTFTIILAALFFIFELEFIKFGPKTTKADAFQIVPLTILGFALIAAFAGYGGNVYIIDFSNTFEMLNYLTVMLFSLVYAFQIAGWNITKAEKTTNQLILVLAFAAVATALMGTYQGTLFQWS